MYLTLKAFGCCILGILFELFYCSKFQEVYIWQDLMFVQCS